MFGVAVWIFAINRSFVYTCNKIKTIEQKTEATLLISRLIIHCCGGRLCFAHPMVLPGQFQPFFKMNENFISFMRYVSIKTFSNSKIQPWHNCTDNETDADRHQIIVRVNRELSQDAMTKSKYNIIFLKQPRVASIVS